MIGDYTEIPLRPDERWTAARMQEGRVLLDHEWNLNLDAASRAAEWAAADVIGPAGVAEGSDAFAVAVTTSGALDLTVRPGRIWVGGMAALAPAPFAYSAQDQIDDLPGAGRAFVYLDAFPEHVQPAESPDELIDPALAPIDSAARSRVGYRVRCRPTAAATCAQALAEVADPGLSGGRLTVTRTGATAPADPCAPPGDPLGRMPDGLFRVEVLDSGAAAAARFAWSFENGAAAVAVAGVAGDTVTLRPSQTVAFSDGDLVEVSWLARRADRVDHGALYAVDEVTPAAGGDVLRLDRAVAAPAGAEGLVVRRWDGQVVGAATARPAAFRGDDIGVRFGAAAGTYLAGDWWGARLREADGDGIEHRTDAPPDGVRHSVAPLALVDLTARTVIADCRPVFRNLVALSRGRCTVVARPGDDLQAAVDRLPPEGGELCLAAGLYPLDAPLVVAGRVRVVISGAGPATVLRAIGREAAVVVDRCREVEVRHLRAEGGSPGAPPGSPHLNGALTFVASSDVGVSDCILTCPDSSGLAQTCLTVRSGEGGLPERVRIERNHAEVGSWQGGLLVVDAGRVLLAGNQVGLREDAGGGAALAAGGGQALARALVLLLAQGTRRGPEGGAREIDVPGSSAGLFVVPGSDAEEFVESFAKMVTAAFVERQGGAQKALRAFARRLAQGQDVARLSPAARAALDRLQGEWQAVAQGIVVAGSRLGTAQVHDNQVAGAVQGIHVGVSLADVPGREQADEVVLRGNVVHCTVPRAYDRDRHAVFVGNARSVHVIDTVATVTRTGQAVGDDPPSPMEGIRLHGHFGPFLAVRNSSLKGVTVGVRVTPLQPIPKQRMWLVSETMADGAGVALAAPGSVDRERNVP